MRIFPSEIEVCIIYNVAWDYRCIDATIVETRSRHHYVGIAAVCLDDAQCTHIHTLPGNPANYTHTAWKFYQVNTHCLEVLQNTHTLPGSLTKYTHTAWKSYKVYP